VTKRTAQDIEAEAEAARARFDEDALTGRPVAEAREWCQARGFRVLVQQKGGAFVFSRNANRARLIVDDGIVVGAHLG
jgi:hypothetical protein